MRKIYIKPEMNSEEFVTNEYIAACWSAECKTLDHYYLACYHQTVTVKSEEKPELEAIRSIYGSEKVWWNGSINGVQTYHYVQSFKRDTDNFS